MERWIRLALYFGSWTCLAILTTLLNILNIDWSETHIIGGIVMVLVLAILQGFVLEYPIQTIFCIIFGGHKRNIKTADGSNLTLILNYNLLATSKDEIDECMQNMYDAYMGNIAPNTAAVLVSATKEIDLRNHEIRVRDNYRSLIFDELYQEGISYSHDMLDDIDELHMTNIWSKYKEVDITEFRNYYLYHICCKFVDDFMVIHRTSKVLRKCGQYQDLMLLSEGDMTAYTYCDQELYSKAARNHGEPLFDYSEDVNRIRGRQFDFTLVLDSDTQVPKATAFTLLDIAAANPERGIIQPAIFLDCKKNDTIFMHLESMRQAINEPLTNAMGEILEQSSFYGKGLLNNKIYISRILGTRENLIERVPIDVLSHDTFEAAIMHPLYAGSVQLKETPSYNYVTWNIRERRWNKGEVLLAIYFFGNVFGKLMRTLQRKFQKSKFIETKLRTVTKLDLVSSFVGHSALRQMFMKPLLLLFIIVHLFNFLIFPYIPIGVTMFFVIVFPKLATCNRHNFKFVVLETIASIFQFTPEAVTGSVRIVRAFHSIIFNNTNWVPQRTVEIEFENSNPFVSALHHLWGYSVFAVILGSIVMLFVERSYLFLFMAASVFLLPLFAGFTSLPFGFAAKYRPTVDVAVSSSSNISAFPQSKLLSSDQAKSNKIFQFNPTSTGSVVLPAVSTV